MQRVVPMQLSFEGREMEKWNITMDRAQRVNEKNGVTCLVIMCTVRIMVIKMPKWLIFLFSADDRKK